MNQSPHPKNSGRRRNVRNATPQKTYASENDAANYHHVLSDSPYTPHKVAATNGAVVNPHVQSATQKKPRNRNTSSKKNKQDRPSPTQPQAVPLAFAGASFHASPAPNSLPLPSFLARTTSAPDSPSLKKPPGPGPAQELSPPTTDSEEDSSPSPPMPPVSRNEESPLELFFKADRAEKARVRRASSANAAGFLAGPFSPPHDSPREPSTFPKLHGIAPPRRPTVQRIPSLGIPSSELDGTPGRPVGQAFSTPYSERIKAARFKNVPAQATPSASNNDTSDRSEALKRFLGVGITPSPARTPNGHPQSPTHQDAPPKLPRGVFPASVVTGHSSPQRRLADESVSRHVYHSQTHLRGGDSVDAGQADNHSDQARKLEDSLRRVLKLGPN